MNEVEVTLIQETLSAIEKRLEAAYQSEDNGKVKKHLGKMSDKAALLSVMVKEYQQM